MKDKSLQVAIKAISERGLERSIDLGPEWFSQWQEEDPGLEFTDAQISGAVRLEKHGRDILVRGHLLGHLQLSCSRCLENFALPVDGDFDLLLAPRPEQISGQDEELSAADLDVDYYSGEVLNLGAILREQIILMVPLKPLCTEECRGLCPRCGALLNREECTCI
ncbi:MAG: DUF177 domain-containing protein [Thermodesulfobacteriota bacterium]